MAHVSRFSVCALTVALSLTSSQCGGGLNTGDEASLPAWTGFRLVGASGAVTQSIAAAVDSAHNVYSAGNSDGALNGAPIGTNDAYLAQYDASGTKQWLRAIGAPAAQTTASAVVSSHSGHVYVFGTTAAPLDGNAASGALLDFFVAQYDESGHRQWTRQAGAGTYTTSIFQSTGGAVGSSGEVYITGTIDAALDGYTPVGTNDFFITRYDIDGRKKWTRGLGVASASTLSTRIASDPQGRIHVTGATTGSLDGVGEIGTVDAFLTVYDSSGNRLRTRLVGHSGEQTGAYAVATDASGGSCIAGETQGALDGNASIGGLTNNKDAFVTCFDADGTKRWTRLIGSPGAGTFANAVAIDASGSVYVSGETEGTIVGTTRLGTEDAFIARYDSGGTLQWIRIVGAPGGETVALDLTIDTTAPEGRVFVAGATEISLPGTSLSGTTDGWIGLFGLDGTLR
jgi:hypothetical protein